MLEGDTGRGLLGERYWERDTEREILGGRHEKEDTMTRRKTSRRDPWVGGSNTQGEGHRPIEDRFFKATAEPPGAVIEVSSTS